MRAITFSVPWAVALLPAVAAVAGAVLPPYWVTLLNYTGIGALVALGLVLLTGVAGLTSFGQAAFVGLGAYTTGVLSVRYGVSPWFALLLGLAFTFLVAWFIGLITLRLSGHYLALATIAWGISLYFLFGNLALLGKFDGLTGIPGLTIAGHPFSDGRSMLLAIWVALALAIFFTRNLLDSQPGRAIRALKGGTTMAEAFGVDTARYKSIAFIIAALFACMAGWLYAHLQRAIPPSPFGINAGIEYLFMAVLGGATSVWGAVVGAGLVTFTKDILQDALPKLLGTRANYEAIVFGVLLVFLLQRAPEGLWPVLSSLLKRWRRDGGAVRRVGSSLLPLARRQSPRAGEVVLEVRRVQKAFGGLVAVNDVSFRMRGSEIVGLIGPNGAGKSTLFNAVTGVVPADSGEIEFLGAPVRGLRARAIAARGVSRTFQHVQLIQAMSVLENVALGAHLRCRVGIGRAGLRLDGAQESSLLAEASRQLDRVGLADQAHLAAGDLSLGQQRILEIARALAADPVLLLLDEPAAGLRYGEKQTLATLLRQLRAEGMTILLVEHDMDFVMDLVDRVVVMNFGSKLAEGDPSSVRKDPSVIEAYLGTNHNLETVDEAE